MSGNPITIRSLGPEDAFVLDRVRSGVFDDTLDPARVWAFLATRVNEIVVALDQGEVIGFAYGTMQLRPDKATEFFVNDLGVHEEYRRRGVARRLMQRLCDRAIDRGCAGVWVLTDIENGPGRGFYEATGGAETAGVLMFDWPLE